MDKTAPIAPAIAETIGFPEQFEGLADPCQQGKVYQTLEEILLLRLEAVLAGDTAMV